MLKLIRPAIVSFVAFTILTGVIYPAIVTGVARLAFPARAGGSVLVKDGKAIGSDLIAQSFTDAKYFWPRPSAADYDATAGSGSNLGPSNPALADAVTARIATLRSAAPGNDSPVPVDLVTASASGLDPDISPEAARYQIARVAKARGISADSLQKLVDDNISGRTLGVLGEPRINVLLLNLQLDTPQLTKADAEKQLDGDINLVRGRGFLPDSK